MLEKCKKMNDCVIRRSVVLFLLVLIECSVQAQIVEQVGNTDFSDCKGVTKVKKNIAPILNDDTVSYSYANQNWIYFPEISRPFSGVTFDVYPKSEKATQIVAIISTQSIWKTSLIGLKVLYPNTVKNILSIETNEGTCQKNILMKISGEIAKNEPLSGGIQNF